MKSEKAKEILSASSITDSCGYEYLLMSCAEKAVEAAERETEERMRERAIEAYCDRCFVGITRECQVSKACCNYLQDFIQILDKNMFMGETPADES